MDGASEHVSTGERRGERRWLPSLVVLVVILLPLFMPEHLRSTQGYLLAVIEVPLLIAIIAIDPGRIDRRTSLLRVLSAGLTGLLVLASIIATTRLIVELVQGAPQMRDAQTLLVSGFVVWFDTNLTFSLLYWELDSGGPATRFLAPLPFPDFAFPQHMNPRLAPEGWMPTYPDYLYLGITNAVAFSPTDVMPLARWAKLTMAVQSMISLAILSLVIANAVNILGN